MKLTIFLINKLIFIIKNFTIFYYIDRQFQIKFKDNVFAKIEINQHFNTDYINIKNYLLFSIDSCRYGNFVFDNIINMEISMISCRCNMTYKYYMNTPMSMLERRINMFIGKNPQLLKSLNIKENHCFMKTLNYIFSHMTEFFHNSYIFIIVK